MRLVGPWLAACLAACLFTAPALARGKSSSSKPAVTKVGQKSAKKAKPQATKAKPTRTAKAPKILALSIGYPNDGKLSGARRFRETRYMKSLPDYTAGQAKWALPELLDLLDRASRAVAKRYPGSVLGVADFSGRDGGPIPRHRSHQTGRDVDVGFYLVAANGRAMRPLRLVDMKADGTSTVRQTTRFDEKRNWAFIAALLQDKEVKVTNIFVWAPLRARLLAHAEKIGAPRALRQKAAQVMSQPANVQRHADHFHIRIACPDSLVGKGCIESARRRPSPVIVAEPSKGSPSPLGNSPPDSLFGDDDEDFEAPAPAPKSKPVPSEPRTVEEGSPAAPAPEESPAPKTKPAPAAEPAPRDELPPLPKPKPSPESEPPAEPAPVAEPKRKSPPAEPSAPPSSDSAEEAKG